MRKEAPSRRPVSVRTGTAGGVDGAAGAGAGVAGLADDEGGAEEGARPVCDGVEAGEIEGVGDACSDWRGDSGVAGGASFVREGAAS